MSKINQIIPGLVAIFAMFLSTGVWAQYPGASPDWWPCIQRYIPALSSGVFWTGEIVAVTVEEIDPRFMSLAEKVTGRNLSSEQAFVAIDTFLDEQDDNKLGTAELLVSAITEAINTRRDRVVAGLMRYSNRQQTMLARIDEQEKKIEGIKDDESKRETLEDLQVRQKWDIRIFEERERLSSALCEQPVVLEQKYFALGKHITAYLEKTKKVQEDNK